jgi:hypothetical protein
MGVLSSRQETRRVLIFLAVMPPVINVFTQNDRLHEMNRLTAIEPL